jgi:hypothetical protein
LIGGPGWVRLGDSSEGNFTTLDPRELPAVAVHEGTWWDEATMLKSGFQFWGDRTKNRLIWLPYYMEPVSPDRLWDKLMELIEDWRKWQIPDFVRPGPPALRRMVLVRGRRDPYIGADVAPMVRELLERLRRFDQV